MDDRLLNFAQIAGTLGGWDLHWPGEPTTRSASRTTTRCVVDSSRGRAPPEVFKLLRRAWYAVSCATCAASVGAASMNADPMVATAPMAPRTHSTCMYARAPYARATRCALCADFDMDVTAPGCIIEWAFPNDMYLQMLLPVAVRPADSSEALLCTGQSGAAGAGSIREPASVRLPPNGPPWPGAGTAA
jgi:hypothetical protein